MSRLPTMGQMVNRSNDGHRKALRCIAEGRSLLGPAEPTSSLRGMRTILGTLYRWDCVADDKLTERGRDLLALLEAKWKTAAWRSR